VSGVRLGQGQSGRWRPFGYAGWLYCWITEVLDGYTAGYWKGGYNA
jgi:hypothetical protein